MVEVFLHGLFIEVIEHGPFCAGRTIDHFHEAGDLHLHIEHPFAFGYIQFDGLITNLLGDDPSLHSNCSWWRAPV